MHILEQTYAKKAYICVFLKLYVMKYFKLFAIAALVAFSLSSCGSTRHMVSNYNVAQTQLVLSGDNFRVIGNVEGRAHATYVFGIGGLSKAAVEENAIADMYRNADLSGAQAVTNVTTTVKTRVFPFVVCYEYIASGQVIEFTE